MAKSFTDIMAGLIISIESSISNVDTRVGTVLREAFLAPVAQQFEDAFSRIDIVGDNQGVENPESLDDNALNATASNFGLNRFTGSPASGSVRFLRFQAPTSSISIPSGTVLYTSSSTDSLSFSTLSSVSLSGASPVDPESGASYVDVSVIANSNGSDGNVIADSITLHSVLDIDEVTNPFPLSGGKDIQTNTELAELIIARAQGNLGTLGGYESQVRENFSVDDMVIISPTDTEAKRSQFGGALDIVILSDQFIQSVEVFPFIDVPTTTSLVPSFDPLTAVIDIKGFDLGDVEQTLVPVTDYTVVLDTTSPLSRSSEDLSRVDLHISSFTPKPATTITMTYNNRELVRTIQTFLSDEANAIIGADVLVKDGVQIDAEITADIKLIPGFGQVTTQAAVVAAIQAQFDALLLGVDVQLSDVITVIGSIEGVDSVDLTTLLMAKASAPATPLQEIDASKAEYIRVSDITVTVV